jgi:hypothetical protein
LRKPAKLEAAEAEQMASGIDGVKAGRYHIGRGCHDET